MGLGGAALMLLLIGTVQSQGVPELYRDAPLTCPDETGGTYLGGDKCYWVFRGDQKRTWYHANQVCESHGMHLVVLKDQEESNKVGRLVNPDPNSQNPPYEEFWIGVHCPEENCATGAFDSYEKEVTHNQASWADGEPAFADGQCFFTSKNEEHYEYDKPYVQSACNCNIKRAFVCEKPAVPQNSFMCFTRGFTDAGNVCNGRQDCVDGSDEINCGSSNLNLCHYHFKAASGQFNLPDGNQFGTNYENSTTCTWAIETPIGTNAFINFTRFDTEPEADIVQVYVGSIIEINADPMATLSGQLNTNRREYEYLSPNNMITIKFMSDSYVTGSGFSVEFGSVELPHEVTRLRADYSSNVYVTPVIEVGEVRSFLGMADYEILIEASDPYQIVTVESGDNDVLLGDNDKIDFYDGESYMAKKLLTVCKTCPDYKVITSTGKYMLIHLSTDKPVESRFVFRYKQGCDVTFTSNYGMLFSPGYVGRISYPNNVMCTWTINTNEPISIYFESDMQLVDDHRCIENSNDYLKIYKGLNGRGTALHTGEGFKTSELAGKVFQSDSNGQIFISFKTSPTANERGFMVKWSKDCVNPMYDSYTIIDNGNTAVAPYHYRASMTLTCALGYGFHQQQFAPLTTPTLSVTLTCGYKGEWNYRYIPRCTANYCGDVPRISNGYIAYSTGSLFGSMASYECYPGSQPISQVGPPGNTNITCERNSQWQLPPTCQTASCNIGLINLNIANGGGRIRDNTGDGSTIGSIIDYECDDGFQIDGEPILICTNNGQWSASSPFCRRKTCLVPSITNGNVSPNTVLIDFNSVASVTCATGYTFEDPTITSMRCMADRNVNQVPKCVDEDECSRQFPPCEHQCRNLVGSYLCSCNPGYEPLQSDPDRCTASNINECNNGTHACDQGCSNVPGGYTCSCTLPRILYTTNGLSGYFIPQSEDGLNDLDTYKLNKSCVLISCPTPQSVNNARLLTLRTYHRYGDLIEYRCEQGYRPQFASSLIRECDINGDWTGTLPTCIPATCPEDYNSFPSPQNPASYVSGPYSYDTTLSLNCTKGSQTFTQNRQCVYNRYTDVYELQGSSYECGVIDCGQPERVAGSVYTVLNTIYPTSFEFACSSGNQPSGSSINPGTDRTVSCGEDGHWMFGSLQCYSQACPDPGYPAGGRMIATSLADQSVVTFECTKQGYTLSHNRPLTCTGTSWNDVVPSCIDTTRPTIQLNNGQPCDGTYVIPVRKYDSIDLRNIAVSYSDNDRIMSFVVEPRNVNTTLKVANDMTVRYTATDYSLNQAICEISIRVTDEEPPTIQCPPQSSLTVYIDDENDTPTLEITESMFTVNDNFGRSNLQPVQISPRPPTTFSFADMYQTYLFRASVSDQSNNAATCQAQVFVTRRECTPNSFPTPLNAVKVCTPFGGFGGWSCTITCDARYTFEDDGGNGKQRTVTCQSGGNWDTAFISACVLDRTYPVVTCPTSSTIYFSSLDDSQLVEYLTLPYSASDLNTLTQRTFSPESSYNFTGADLFRTREITMFVEDNAGLVSSCKFQYIVLPRIGSPLAYPNILYGSKSCSRTFNPLGYQCTITCNPGYVLRDYGISTVVNSVDGSDWDEIIPACVSDNIPPIVSCPRSKTLRLQHATDNVTINFGVNDFNDFTSTDAGGIATSTFSPATYTFTTSNLYTAVPITLTVLDNGNNAASCSFSVRTMPAVCSELSLPSPANGRRDCTENFNGWTCTLTCNTGYSFSHTTDVSQTISCTDGEGWVGQVPGCSPDSDTTSTVYFAEVEYRYQPVTGVLNVSRDCLSFYQNQQGRDTLTTTGTVSLYEAMATKMAQGCILYANVPANVDINITFLPQYFETTLERILTSSVPQFRQIVIEYTFTMTISDSTHSENCKNWFFDNMARTPNSFEFAKNIPGDGGICPELRWDNTMEVLSNGSRCLGNRYISLFDPGLCKRCPPGSVSDSAKCSVCPLGQYHGNTDAIQCSTCPVGSTTRYPGATFINDCITPCRAGQFSDDGFEPCSSAPVGYYTLDGITLTSCPFGRTTTTVGSSSVDACVTPAVQTEPCGAGTQFDGNTCQLCDLGYYRTVLQSSCQRCPLTGTTTYIRGAISDSSCYGGCGGGLTSANGLAPCTACPRGSYYVNSTYCQSCAQGLTTRFVGATGPQECISQTLLRVNCPRGKYRDSNTGQCQPCAVGTYSDNEEVSQCISCPPGSSTYHAGSTSRAMCFTMCPSGTTSTTGLSPCTPCGFGSYAVSPTTCASCPAGTTTKTNYASTQAECIPECSVGSFSVSGYNFDNTCRLCPANFYQDQTGQTTCKQCSPAQFTEPGQTGADSSTDCLNTAFDRLCPGHCNQAIGGVCSIEDHTYNCTCPAGYYGADCEYAVNYCENNPCFNNGQCQSTHNGPICNCGNFAYGEYCENVNVTCTPDYCENGGYCLNMPGYQQCLCTEGYSGTRCASQQSICPINPADNPCQNGGVCEDTSFGKNLRRKCNCREGWTGANCEIMIDLCESTPCLYGARCVPELNNYRCECPSQYSGKNCQLRQDRCQGYDCNGGQCVDDYMSDEPRCLCAPGFIYGSVYQYNIRLDTAYSPLPANPELTGVTVQDCKDRCSLDSTCDSFSFNVAQGSCYIWRNLRAVTLTQSFGYNHYTKETIAQATDDYWTDWFDVSRPTNSNGNDDRELRADLINTYGINVCEGSEPISVECRDVATGNPVSSLSGVSCTIDGLTCDGFGPCLNYEVRYKCAVHRVFKNNRCERLDACLSNPCPPRQSTGCRTVNDNYECICAEGYTGRSCQINIDDCERLQCQNGGVCIDRLGGIDCDCTNAIGYTGTLCDIRLDYCDGQTCSGHGRCENLLTNYVCVCNIGWEGRDCETLTDTCKADPCLHGGTCVQPANTVNFYQCQCADGWTGTNCEQIVDYCAIGGQRTCRAQCYSIFSDYYCKCPAYVYDRDCENSPNPCANYNKCLTQNGGVCSYDSTAAQMTCTCTDPRYTGDGCHILVDHCSANSNNCLNGGTCHIQPSGYRCECPAGYTGTNCETEINECLGISCPGGGACFNDIGRYYCRCPLTKTGANCFRDYDPKYDICFNHPLGLSYAWVPFPNQVVNGDRMTVTLWVRFTEPGSTGTFFNMFIGDRLETSFKFMDFRHDGVRIYISTDGGITPYTLLPFSFTHAVTDGNWHSIVLNYNLAEGRIALIKNSIKMTLPDFESPALIIPDRTFKFWSVIGCEFNQATKSCVAGNIFHGCVSQVNFYDRNLDFNFEIHDLLTEPRKVYDPFVNVLLVWNEYLLESGSGRIIPSEANRLPCPGRCRTYSALSRPTLSSSKPCPGDQVIYSTDRLTTVTWEEPAFEGAVNLIRPREYQSGASYHWGTYQITYIAEADSGEKAFCSFKLYVRSSQCEAPQRPLGGNIQEYETDPDGYTGFTLACDATSLIDRVTPRRFTCDRTGSWNAEKRFNRFMLPPCGAVSTNDPRDSLLMAVSYEIGTIACQDAEIDFKARTRQAFEDLNDRTRGHQINGVNEICGVSDCSDLTIEVLCGQTGLQNQVVAILEVPDCLHRISVDGISMLTSDFITCSVLGPARILNFNDTIPLASIEDPTYSITPTRICPAGRVLINDLCVECGAGTYWYKPSVNAPAYCESCRRGEYQGQTGQMSCESCGSGLTTEMMGSTGFEMCKAICGLGQYFDLDTDQCRDCPVGFYQDEEGQFFCKFCLRGYTTKEAGSVTVAACQVTCGSGEELSDTGCVKCAKGYFRDETQSRTCQPCPGGKITQDVGAVSVAQCNIEACEAGSRLDVTNTCELCDIGYYQDEKWQISCKSCGDPNNWRTDSRGSADPQDCKFYCPEGYEAHDITSPNPYCKICDIGFYKNNLISYYSQCTACTGNYRTKFQGSISQQNCTIYKCPVGQQPNAGNNGCEECGLGYYQPLEYQEECLKCQGDYSTRTTGSTSGASCENYCAPGEEKQASGRCVQCLQGYYKDNDLGLFTMCTACPENYTTLSVGAIKAVQCAIRDCGAGYKRNNDDTACIPCQQGTYQQEPYKDFCVNCPPNQSTRTTAATSPSQCEVFCNPGQEKTDRGCEPCARGYYKTNLIDVFSMCVMCPIDRITPSIGSDEEADCTQENCTAGYRLDLTTNRCVICPKGTYQTDTWQTRCIDCGPDRTTENVGATSPDLCILSCPPGTEDIGGSCKPCPRGTYKTQFLAAACTPCPQGFTTEGTGAETPARCTLPACAAGYYLDRSATPVDCKKCDYGQYQDQIWQESCKSCPGSLVTLWMAATTASDCVTDCASGSEYNFTSQVCDTCPRGYYRNRNDRIQYECQLCADLNFITAGTGANSSAQCNVRNCTQAGYYLDVPNNQCRQCPRGTYLDQKWQTRCTDCPNDYSTLDIGSTSINDCRRTCPLGQYVTTNNQCLDCEIGSYRDASSGELCVLCPDGLLTPTTGATSDAQCTLSPCNEGEYYIRGQLRCAKCARGTYQDQKYKFQCIDCPYAIKYTPQTGADSLALCASPCTFGQQMNPVTLTCEACPVGYYQESDKQFVCVECPVGRKYTVGTGSTKFSDCKDICEAGNDCSLNANCISGASGYTCQCFDNYMDVNNNGRNCQACSAGQYYVANQCRTCPSGQYQPNPAMDSCLPCAAGTISTPGRVVCAQCESGTYSNSGSNICLPCPAGQYQPNTGEATCLTCPDGTEVNNDRTGCSHLCDLGYCLNGGTCDVGPPVKCTCTEWYTGNKCQTRKNSENVAERNVENIVIPVAISIGALLLIILAIAVACFICLRKPPSKAVQYTEFAGERNDKVSVHSYGNTPYNFTANKMMLQPASEVIIENPAYQGSAVGGDPAVYTA